MEEALEAAGGFAATDDLYQLVLQGGIVVLAEVSEGKSGGCSTFVGAEMSVEIDGCVRLGA